ncbi:hypothetical protein [Methylobacterium sp. JK268]
MTIRVFVCVDEACPPDRLWLPRIERGTTATTVFGPTQADVRLKAAAAAINKAHAAPAARRRTA